MMGVEKQLKGWRVVNIWGLIEFSSLNFPDRVGVDLDVQHNNDRG
jgi:hypothetical protein